MMTDPTPQAVALFHSVSHALRAEKVAKAAGLACKLIPVPRHLSSDCGVCLRFPLADQNAMKQILSSKIDFFEIFPL